MDGVSLFDFLDMVNTLTLQDVWKLFEESFGGSAYAVSVVNPI